MKRMNKKGFTIVELVIVIAVIAILAGVLIPTFSGIVGKAQDSAKVQEVRNAVTNYIVENDGVVATGTSFVYLETGKQDVDNDDVLYIYSYTNKALSQTATEKKGTYTAVDGNNPAKFVTTDDAPVTYILTAIKDGDAVVANVWAAKVSE